MFTHCEDYEGFKLQRDTLQLTAGRMCVGVGRQGDQTHLVVLLLARDGDSPVRRDHELNRQGTFAYGTTVRVETTSKEGVRKKSHCRTRRPPCVPPPPEARRTASGPAIAPF